MHLLGHSLNILGEHSGCQKIHRQNSNRFYAQDYDQVIHEITEMVRILQHHKSSIQKVIVKPEYSQDTLQNDLHDVQIK